MLTLAVSSFRVAAGATSRALIIWSTRFCFKPRKSADGARIRMFAEAFPVRWAPLREEVCLGNVQPSGRLVRGDAVCVDGPLISGAPPLQRVLRTLLTDAVSCRPRRAGRGDGPYRPTLSRVPGSGVRGRGSGERETTASSLAGKQQAREKEDNGGQGKDGPAGAIAQRGEWTVTWTSYGRL